MTWTTGLSRSVRFGAFTSLMLFTGPLLACSTSKEWLAAPNFTERHAGPNDAPTQLTLAGEPRPDEDPNGLFAYTEPGELPQLLIADDPDGARLPLEHTDVHAQVRGHVAEVRVKQRFKNSYAKTIEVTYTFPLPENSAVDSMRMIIGERVIESEVQTRERARETYEAARSAGHTAALLEQERPNIFTQSVANIAPGETIEVEIAYLQTLTQDGGMQEFVFPMVVGPRFIPGQAVGHEGSGREHDTNLVPDASRITPPIVGQGERTGHDVSLSLDVDVGIRVERWITPTHAVSGQATSAGFSVALAEAKTIPNRDFVIRWQAANDKPRATLYLGPTDTTGAGHFTLLVHPPQFELDELVGRRQMIFVVDRSGSMSGVPLELAKQTLRQALPRLRPVDTFDVIGFESGTEVLFGTPRPANDHNLAIAEKFIDGMQAAGGTMMRDAVTAALGPNVLPGEPRYVFFLTDGFIGNEHEIFSAASLLVRRAAHVGGRSRVFGLGIGSSPNRHLIDGLSEVGDAVPLYVSNHEHPDTVVNDYYHYVDHAVLTDLSVDWGGLVVDEVYPNVLPDLFASRVVIVHGRYSGHISGPVEIHALVPDPNGNGKATNVTLVAGVSASAHDDRILSTLWAREKIADITAATWDGELSATESAVEITGVGLEYHLVTEYTSFVAVDRSRTIGNGQPTHVIQPVLVPEDVDPVMSGAAEQLSPRSSSSSSGVTTYDFEYDDVDGEVLAPEGVSMSSRSRTKHAPMFDQRGHFELQDLDSPISMSEPVDTENGCCESPREQRESTPAHEKKTNKSKSKQAKLSVGKIRTSEGVDARALERAVEADAWEFERCYLKASAHDERTLAFRLEFDANGALVTIALIRGTIEQDVRGCFEQALTRVSWRGLPGAAAAVELELRRSGLR
jgi:Ca-activated chloride channel family protein